MLSSTSVAESSLVLPALEVVARIRIGERIVGAVHMMEREQDQVVVEEVCTTEVASRNHLDLMEVRTLVDSARTLRLLAGSSQLDAGKQPDQQLAVSAVPFVRDTAATLQLPVRTEKSAQTQLEPMLESMAVAETEHSALA